MHSARQPNRELRVNQSRAFVRLTGADGASYQLDIAASVEEFGENYAASNTNRDFGPGD